MSDNVLLSVKHLTKNYVSKKSFFGKHIRRAYL